MDMIRHDNRREYRPMPQPHCSSLERSECSVVREHWLTVLNTESHEIDDTLIPSGAKPESWEDEPCGAL
jgi:hypothetical protein